MILDLRYFRSSVSKQRSARDVGVCGNARRDGRLCLRHDQHKESGMSVTRENEQKIRDRAYTLWEKEGRPEGRHSDHWHQATRELGEVDHAIPEDETPNASVAQDPTPKRQASRTPRKKPSAVKAAD
jgi:hypothetical protein